MTHHTDSIRAVPCVDTTWSASQPRRRCSKRGACPSPPTRYEYDRPAVLVGHSVASVASVGAPWVQV